MTAAGVIRPGLAPPASREARLQPQHAILYPGIPAGVWQPAAVLADGVLAGRLLRGVTDALWGRVLVQEHFEFRGGEAARRGVREGHRPGRRLR